MNPTPTPWEVDPKLHDSKHRMRILNERDEDVSFVGSFPIGKVSFGAIRVPKLPKHSRLEVDDLL